MDSFFALLSELLSVLKTELENTGIEHCWSFWIRCSVASFRTHKKEIDEALQLIKECSDYDIRKTGSR